MDLKEITKQLTERRIERGLSQSGLARYAGLSSHAVSSLERGYRSGSTYDTVRRMATALGYKIALVEGEE